MSSVCFPDAQGPCPQFRWTDPIFTKPLLFQLESQLHMQVYIRALCAHLTWSSMNRSSFPEAFPYRICPNCIQMTWTLRVLFYQIVIVFMKSREPIRFYRSISWPNCTPWTPTGNVLNCKHLPGNFLCSCFELNLNCGCSWYLSIVCSPDTNWWCPKLQLSAGVFFAFQFQNEPKMQLQLIFDQCLLPGHQPTMCWVTIICWSILSIPVPNQTRTASQLIFEHCLLSGYQLTMCLISRYPILYWI